MDFLAEYEFNAANKPEASTSAADFLSMHGLFEPAFEDGWNEGDLDFIVIGAQSDLEAYLFGIRSYLSFKSDKALHYFWIDQLKAW